MTLNDSVGMTVRSNDLSKLCLDSPCRSLLKKILPPAT